jgi:hypothetical protein
VQAAKMQLKEFSLFVPNVESGTVFKELFQRLIKFILPTIVSQLSQQHI